MKQQLQINPDGGERLVYNNPEFPVRCVPGDLSRFYDFAAGCHWHNDFEILFAREGDIDYFVNGRVVAVKQGQAIFVNSNRLHYGFSGAQKECLYTCLVFHPDIFGSPAMSTSRYVRQLTADDRPDYLLLTDPDSISLIESICKIYEEKSALPELAVLAACCGLLRLLWQRMDVCQENVMDAGWLSLRQMIGYLQTNYASGIRLEDIAAAGAVCRSKCCTLFREKLNTTPMGYLNRYRMEKARELLSMSEDSITKIANKCGFDNPSYFSELFRKTYGEAPRMVRNKSK